jgi:hypothetical protein
VVNAPVAVWSKCPWADDAIRELLATEILRPKMIEQADEPLFVAQGVTREPAEVLGAPLEK